MTTSPSLNDKTSRTEALAFGSDGAVEIKLSSTGRGSVDTKRCQWIDSPSLVKIFRWSMSMFITVLPNSSAGILWAITVRAPSVGGRLKRG
jgi:hypothetical protein